MEGMTVEQGDKYANVCRSDGVKPVSSSYWRPQLRISGPSYTNIYLIGLFPHFFFSMWLRLLISMESQHGNQMEYYTISISVPYPTTPNKTQRRKSHFLKATQTLVSLQADTQTGVPSSPYQTVSQATA